MGDTMRIDLKPDAVLGLEDVAGGGRYPQPEVTSGWTNNIVQMLAKIGAFADPAFDPPGTLVSNGRPAVQADRLRPYREHRPPPEIGRAGKQACSDGEAGESDGA